MPEPPQQAPFNAEEYLLYSDRQFEVKVSSPLLNTAWAKPRLLLLRRQTAVQNLLQADRKSSAMASPTPSHALALASATLPAATFFSLLPDPPHHLVFIG